MKYLNSFNESLSQNWYYEFHLSTEPDLKIGENFKKQIRTNSSFAERGDSMERNNYIYSTNDPEDWYAQFQMELNADAPEYSKILIYSKS